MKLGSRSQLSNFIHLEIQLYTSHYFVAENSCTRRMNKQCPIEHLPHCLLAETRDVTENCALKYHFVTPRACARGKAIPSVRRLSVSLSVCLSSAKKILQADTSSTYNRNISFANSPILTFVYLIILNTLQFSVLSGLSYPVQLVVHLEIPYIEWILEAARGVSIQRIHSSCRHVAPTLTVGKIETEVCFVR